MPGDPRQAAIFMPVIDLVFRCGFCMYVLDYSSTILLEWPRTPTLIKLTHTIGGFHAKV